MRVAAMIVATLALTGCNGEDTSFSYVIEPSQVAAGENPVATFTNTGDTTIGYGSRYVVERRTPRGWEEVTQPPNPEIYCAFTDILLLLEPGASETEEISVCDRRGEPRTLVPGLYRVTKEVTTEGETDEVHVARATFDVSAP